jgi:hypothetical protein
MRKIIVMILSLSFGFSLFDRAFPYGIGTGPNDLVPVHQHSTNAAANIWSDPDGEIRGRISEQIWIDKACNLFRLIPDPDVGYNIGDDVTVGSKEEDEQFNDFCLTISKEICDGFALM